jgi:cytochrome c553
MSACTYRKPDRVSEFIRLARCMLALAGWMAVLLPHVSVASSVQQRADQFVHTALKLTADASRGEAIYRENCARCHYEAASGDPGNLVPKLAGQRKSYLVKQLADFAANASEGEEMHSVVSLPMLDKPQAWADVATYLSHLPSAGGAETGSGSSIKLGETIFQKSCAICHAADARGSSDGFVPALRDQHYSYLIWQMRSVASSRRPHVHPDMVKVLGALNADDIAAVADYLSRMSGLTASGVSN